MESTEQVASFTLDGMTVSVHIERTEDGPLLILGSEGCMLEGIAPGEYLMLAHAATR